MDKYIHVYAVLDGAAHRMLMHAWLATACTVSDKFENKIEILQAVFPVGEFDDPPC